MEIVEYAGKFCEPVASDEVLRDPMLNPEMYSDLVLERNAYELCGWAKCGKKVRVLQSDTKAIFCSKKCQFMSQQFLASLMPEERGPVGKIVEEFADQRPPKPLKRAVADEIEGFRVRVGPYRNQLNEIEKWFGGFRVVSFTGMSPAQSTLLTFVNEHLRKAGVQLKATNMDVIDFFVNIDVRDPKVITEAPDPLKMAFSLAIYEYLVAADVKQALGKFDIPVALYEDILEIVMTTDNGDW